MRHRALLVAAPVFGALLFVATPARGTSKPAVVDSLCVACHTIGGVGGQVGPALDGVGSKFDKTYLDKWLADPNAVKPGTTMPPLGLSDDDRKAVVDYLMTLK